MFVSHTPGKHTAPVWHIKWIEKERGSGEESSEVVVSISTDGRVTQWSIRKGFECYGKILHLHLLQDELYIYISIYVHKNSDLDH